MKPRTFLGTVAEGRRKLNRMKLSLWWFARISGGAVALPFLLLMVMGGEGNGATTGGNWVYFAFFPIGFSVAYLIGWRWPLVGGTVSLACMAISHVVMGRVLPSLVPYIIYGVLCVPGVLYVIVGLRLRATAGDSEVPGS
jgi:hypothetical protein